MGVDPASYSIIGCASKWSGTEKNFRMFVGLVESAGSPEEIFASLNCSRKHDRECTASHYAYV